MLWYTIANIDILTLEHMLGIFKKSLKILLPNKNFCL